MDDSSLYSVGEMKRADVRSSMKILVLGDEGVGKSSLISTFVSRYFSEIVPGRMTRVRLPPDPSLSSCVTTIIDTQGGDSALIQSISSKFMLQQQQLRSATSINSLQALLEQSTESIAPQTGASLSPIPAAAAPSATVGLGETSDIPNTDKSTTSKDQAAILAPSAATLSGSTTSTTTSSSSNTAIENVDSIILVYDLDRVESFFRLENHWLPLIEKCYDGKIPVIVAENKMDLFRPSSISSTNVSPEYPTPQSTSDEQALARKRQQIVSLMQRFPFIRQCIKCSAKTLLHVDDIFKKAQQAVLYPFTPPLYNLDTGTLSVECERALARIFRIFDKDYDNLLSDNEIDRFQRETYYVAVFDRDLAAWKKVVSRNHDEAIGSGLTGIPNTAEPVLRDGKFTVAGFHAIFDVFISQNRLDVVWQALRKYGYDDDLSLHIPKSIIWPNADTAGVDGSGKNPSNVTKQQIDLLMQNWKLSSAAKKFLANVFLQFDSDDDGMLSQDDLLSIFSVLSPPALPPWHPIRARDLFDQCFSKPKQALPASGNVSQGGSVASEASPTIILDNKDAYMSDSTLIVPEALSPPISQSFISHSGLSILSASDSLPSIDVGGMYPLSKSLSFLEWMGHWHAIAAMSPTVTRVELYRLGHIENYSNTKGKRSKRSSEERRKRREMMASHMQLQQIKEKTTRRNADFYLKSREVRVLVIGSQSCGKTAMLNVLCGAMDRKTEVASGFSSSVLVNAIDTLPTQYPETSATFIKIRRKVTSTSSTKPVVQGEEFVVHLVFTDIPESVASSQKEGLSEILGSKAPSTTKGSAPKDRVFDVVMLVFDCTDSSSFDFVKEFDSTVLNEDTPRLFVGTKADLLLSQPEVDGHEKSTVLEAAVRYCRESDLEPPLLVSATEQPKAASEHRIKVLDHVSRCALTDESGVESLRSRPHEQKRKRRRTIVAWAVRLGIFAVGVGVVGVVRLWRSKDQKVGGSWFRWFDRSFSRSSSPPAVTE